AAEAAGGEMLVSQTVADLVAGSGLEFADRGSLMPAGAGAGRRWRRLAVVDLDPGPPAASAGPLVGRAEEPARRGGALPPGRSGRGSAVLVAGEAGMGKTRLVSEFAEHARAAGCAVFVGRCLDLVGTELPFQPFVEALRRLGRELPFMRAADSASQLRMF